MCIKLFSTNFVQNNFCADKYLANYAQDSCSHTHLPSCKVCYFLLITKTKVYFQSTTKKLQHFLNLLISINCSMCFRRFLRPSSGAQNCTSWMRWNFSFISATIAAGSSIGLTIPNAVCTVLCS